MEELFCSTKDGIKIAFNHYNSGKDSVVIICPGWFMTKDSAAFKNLSEDFAKNFDVITLDFRGSGKSSGLYTFTANEELDLYAVVEFAAEKYKKIYLCGFSLGGAVVINYAAKNKNINKLITVSAPSDFDKIENRMYLPDAWIPTLFQKFEPKRWFTIHPGNPFLRKDKPIELVSELDIPTLFLAGEKDPTVFPWHSKLLFDKAVCKKDYKLFKKARHAEDLYHDFPQEFMENCVNWLNA